MKVWIKETYICDKFICVEAASEDQALELAENGNYDEKFSKAESYDEYNYEPVDIDEVPYPEQR